MAPNRRVLWVAIVLLGAAPACLAQEVVEEELDDQGRVVRELDEAGRETRYRYDVNGGVKVEIDRRAGADDAIDEGFTRGDVPNPRAGSAGR